MVSEHSASDPSMSDSKLYLLPWLFSFGDSPEEDCPFEPFTAFFLGDMLGNELYACVFVPKG
eukprot:8275312-Pyramimonas_sp.AAC.1